MGSGVRLAAAMPAMPVEQGDPQWHPPAGCLAKQVNDGERAAGPAADDCDDKPPASDWNIR